MQPNITIVWGTLKDAATICLTLIRGEIGGSLWNGYAEKERQSYRTRTLLM